MSSAEVELYALTTGLAEEMVTKHLLQELGHEVILINHFDSQSSKAWASKRGLGKKHVMLKYMYVQDVVEKKLTNLAHISTKQNKADLMTKVSHIRSTQERLRDNRIETRLKQNKEVKMHARRSQPAVM